MQEAVLYVVDAAAEENGLVWHVDADSGWEHDEDIVWVVDEGNEAEWAEGVSYWMPPRH